MPVGVKSTESTYRKDGKQRKRINKRALGLRSSRRMGRYRYRASLKSIKRRSLLEQCLREKKKSPSNLAEEREEIFRRPWA